MYYPILFHLISDCDYVIHVAKSHIGEIEKNQDLEGTQSVLRACNDFDLKKCIFTIDHRNIWNYNNIKETYNETDFAIADNTMNIYETTNIQIEEMIWDFKKILSEDSKLELVIMLPGFLLGK